MLDEADFQEDIREGVDVLIYTRTKVGRPWLGRVLRKIDKILSSPSSGMIEGKVM